MLQAKAPDPTCHFVAHEKHKPDQTWPFATHENTTSTITPYPWCASPITTCHSQMQVKPT